MLEPLRVARGVRRGRRAAREDPRGPRTSCPELEHVIVMDPARRRARRRDHARRAARARRAAATSPSGGALRGRHARTTSASTSTRPARPGRRRAACSRTATTARSPTPWSSDERARGRRLRLPLPAARARVRAADPVRARSTSARRSPTGRRTRRRSSPTSTEVKPTLLPVGAADVREDLHARHRAAPTTRRSSSKAVEVGVKVRRCSEARRGGAGGAPGRPSTRPRRQLFKNVRDLFGGNIRECVTGAAPIAQEILEFFYACGVPVMEGYGMTETSTSATVNRPEGDFRFGSVGKPHAGRRGEDRRRRRGPDQGPEHLPGLLQERGGHEARRSRTAGCTPATSAASTRTASSTSPAARRTSSSRRAARTSRRPTSRTGSSRTAGSRRPWWSATAARTWSR